MATIEKLKKRMTDKERKAELKRIERNTRSRISRDNLSCFYAGIDWLTIKLIDGSEEVERIKKIEEGKPYKDLPAGMYIEYFGPVSGGISTVYLIKTKEDQQAGSIAIRNQGVKANKNMPTRVEFGGLFCKAFMEYMPFFYDFLGIDPEAGKRQENGNILKKSPVIRIDYAMDVLGGTVPMFHSYLKDKNQKIKAEGWGSTMTYSRIGNTRNKLAIYNKKLDIIDNKKLKYKGPNGESVYQNYMDEKQPIARIEYRKLAESLSELDDSSLEYLFENIHGLALDYFRDYYEFDIRLLFKKRAIKKRIKSNDEKKADELIEKIVKNKSGRSLQMSKAYADNFTELKSESIYFDHLFQKYGERIINHMIRKNLDFPVDIAFNKATMVLEKKKV